MKDKKEQTIESQSVNSDIEKNDDDFFKNVKDVTILLLLSIILIGGYMCFNVIDQQDQQIHNYKYSKNQDSLRVVKFLKENTFFVGDLPK